MILSKDIMKLRYLKEKGIVTFCFISSFHRSGIILF